MDTGFKLQPKKLLREVYVNSLSDLPTPVGDVITLADNTTYRFTSGTINLGANRIVCNASNRLIGSGPVITQIVSTISSGYFLSSTTAGSGLELRDFTIVLSDAGASLFNLQNLDQLVCYNTFFVTEGSLGQWANIGTTRCNFFSVIGFSTGLEFSGTNGFTSFERCGWINIGASPATDGLLVPAGSSIQTLQIVGNLVYCLPGSNGFNVDASTTFAFGDECYYIGLSKFVGDGTYLAGITESNTNLKAKFNGGVRDTANGMFYRWSSSAATTPTPGTPVKVQGGTTESTTFNRGFDMPSDNGAYMLLSQPATFKVEATLSADIGALLTNYTLYVAVDGIVVNESAVTVRGDAVAGKVVLSTMAVVELDNLQTISIYLDADTANPLTVNTGTVLITQIY